MSLVGRLMAKMFYDMQEVRSDQMSPRVKRSFILHSHLETHFETEGGERELDIKA
jgi:hypothetical protein